MLPSSPSDLSASGLAKNGEGTFFAYTIENKVLSVSVDI